MTEQEIIVSVVIPAYNSASTLEDTVQSVLRQTFRPFEVLIIDDGSTDTTLAVAQSLAERYPAVFAFTQKNARQGKARNHGIEKARGEYIAFLDSDDEWIPEKLDIQVKQIKQSGADLVFSDGFMFITDEKVSLKSIQESSNKGIILNSLHGRIQGKNGIRLIHRKNRIPTSSVLCRKVAIEQAGYFTTQLDLQNCEDYLLWAAMVEQGCILDGYPDTLIYYRVHANSSTNGIKNQLMPLIRCIYHMHLPLSDEQKIQLAGHTKHLLDELGVREDFESTKKLLRLYNRHAVAGLTGLMMQTMLSVGLKRPYFFLFYRHAKRWISKDQDDQFLIGAI